MTTNWTQNAAVRGQVLAPLPRRRRCSTSDSSMGYSRRGAERSWSTGLDPGCV